MKQAFTEFICIKQRDPRLLAPLEPQGHLGHQVSEVRTFSEEVSWVEENQRGIPKGRLRDERISQFFTAHGVSLILPRGLTDLANSHSPSSVGQPPGVVILFGTNLKKTLRSQARVHPLRSSPHSTTQQEKLRSLVVGDPPPPKKMAVLAQGISRQGQCLHCCS